MRFLINANNLLSYRHSPILKSSQQFRFYSARKSYIAGTIRPFNAINSTKLNPNLAFTQQNIQRFISNNSSQKNKNDATKAQPTDTDDENDNVSIYEGKYKLQIIRVKMFSMTTSLVGLMAQPILWNKGLEVSGTGLGVLLCSVAGIFTFVTPLLLHFVTKKYVIDIKYNEATDEYTCVTVSFFLFKNETTFKVEDIEIPEIETMFTSMKIGPKKIPVFVDSASFTDTHHYARFMGYDKPLDFRLNVDEINQKATASSKDKTISNTK